MDSIRAFSEWRQLVSTGGVRSAHNPIYTTPRQNRSNLTEVTGSGMNNCRQKSATPGAVHKRDTKCESNVDSSLETTTVSSCLLKNDASFAVASRSKSADVSTAPASVSGSIIFSTDSRSSLNNASTDNIITGVAVSKSLSQNTKETGVVGKTETSCTVAGTTCVSTSSCNTTVRVQSLSTSGVLGESTV
jgi:hypothetical protein